MEHRRDHVLVLRGKLPFQGENDTQIINSIENDAAQFGDKSWRKRSPELLDFVQRLLRKRPEARLTPGEALTHPWAKLLEEQMNSASAGESESESVSVVEALLSAGDSSGMRKSDLEEKLVKLRKRNVDLAEELRKGRLAEAELVEALARY